jgi:NADH:ubiquinone oxidoreductase subunit K
MIAPYLLKSLGYVISTVSVILLAIVSWQSASKQTALMICLIVGAASSIIGMALRWSSYALEKRRSGSG